MNFGKGVLVRCTAMILLVCVCAAAVLYVEGAFEFSFIDRQPPNENIKPPVTTAPDHGTGTARPSVTEPLSPPDTDETYRDDETTEPSEGTDTSGPADTGTATPSDRFSPPTMSELTDGGYKTTYGDYTSDMVIAEIELGGVYSELYTGSKFFRDSVLATIYSDETFTFGDMKMTSTKRYTIETYMGYIIIGGEKTVAVYDVFGNKLVETEKALSPAYTRDTEDRPLFFAGSSTKNFYYIDHEKNELVLADGYNDEYDNRGLYFDYNPDFGKSDIGSNAAWQVREFYRYFSMNMSTSWHMNNVSPLIAKELQLMYPKYAAMVARFNIRFAHALVQAKIEIAEEEAARREEESKKAEEESKRAEEESKNAELTKDTTTAVSPSDSVSESIQSPPTEAPTGSATDTTVNASPETTSNETSGSFAEPAEITVPEETRSPEASTNSPEGTTAPTDTPAGTDVVTSPGDSVITDINPSTDTSAETLTSPEETTLSPEVTGDESVTDTESVPETTEKPAETTSKYPSNSTTGPIVIEKKFTLPRYGFVNNGKLMKNYTYARAFSFNDGRAAVIDDDGRLTFINYNYQTVITKYSRFKGTFEGADTSTYYISSYYAPVYNNMSSLGHFYFDRGYVTVRHVNIESMFIKRAAYDETYLIDTSGKRIDPPSGYNFVSCSEGIMIVERDGRYGYYDVANKSWVADPIYTYVMPFYEGIGVLGVEGKIGAIDRNGNTVIPFEFEYLSTMSTGLISGYNSEDGWRVFAKMSK